MLPNDVKNQSKFCWTAIVMMSRNCLGAEGSSLVTSRLGSCSSAMSNSPAFFLPFCFLALFSSTSADVGSMIDRAVSSSQDKTQENISRLCTLHESHFWLWRWGRQANTAVIYRTRRSCIRRSFIVCKINNLRQVFFPETAKEKKKTLDLKLQNEEPHTLRRLNSLWEKLSMYFFFTIAMAGIYLHVMVKETRFKHKKALYLLNTS